MSPFLTGLAVGAFLGAIVGTLATCLCVMAARGARAIPDSAVLPLAQGRQSVSRAAAPARGKEGHANG